MKQTLVLHAGYTVATPVVPGARYGFINRANHTSYTSPECVPNSPETWPERWLFAKSEPHGKKIENNSGEKAVGKLVAHCHHTFVI